MKKTIDNYSKEELELLNEKASDVSIWNNPKEAELLNKKIRDIEIIIKIINNIEKDIIVLKQIYEFDESEIDETMALEFEDLYKKTSKEIDNQEIYTFLGKKYDAENAIFEIHAGAGGTESCDWALMLSRMYTKYFNKKGYTYEIINEQTGEETGIKSITYFDRKNNKCN